mmetsp:Transcript_6107/g.14186  ORF Transcript_6107/g.14186 Transcript_6107/m.14186 type:complete len:744 (+) Transcript_6107:164-2395(+)
MSALDKLRQKRLLRQEGQAEALRSGGSSSSLPDLLAGGFGGGAASPPSLSLPASPPARSPQAASPNGAASSKSVEILGATGTTAMMLQASMPTSTSSSSRLRAGQGGQDNSFTPGTCPRTLEELKKCILHFFCDCENLGPFPMSGIGLNAALRREFQKHGCERSALAIFRAADTTAALRTLRLELEPLGLADALAVSSTSSGSDDLFIESVDRTRLKKTLAPSSSSSRGDGDRHSKRRRRRSEFEENIASSFQVINFAPLPGSTSELSLASAASPVPPFSLAMVPAQQQQAGSSVDELLSAPTTKQRQLMDAGDELRKLLVEPTTKQSLIAQKFMNKSKTAAQFCPHGSRQDCRGMMGSAVACTRIHFKKIIKPWTDESLGDCSYLDTCRHIDKCKYVHYALDLTHHQAQYLNECGVQNRGTDTRRINELAMKGTDMPAQWVHCDIRKFPLSIFNGCISVVMADPPWDIHMELPYGTLTDDDVRSLPIGDIHEDGVIFLWVTGRAMELARDCFRIWGYKRIEEIVWVKTNQLQRIIRTGRTGHWINHSKEHCLVGIKGNPKLNRNIDCDVIVSEVRETSRKPDEIYNLIERMFPNCLKLELFGRPHNVHDNWITCGNQLDGVRLCDEEICRRYNEHFPNAKVEPYRRNQDAIIPAAVAGSSGVETEGSSWIPPNKTTATQAWQPPPNGAAASSTSAPAGPAGWGPPPGWFAAPAPVPPVLPPGWGGYPPALPHAWGWHPPPHR